MGLKFQELAWVLKSILPKLKDWNFENNTWDIDLYAALVPTGTGKSIL